MSRITGKGAGEGSFRYRPDCRRAVEEHIARCFGPWEQGFRHPGEGPLEAEVLFLPPREGREEPLLCTLGLGAVTMAPPEGDADGDLRRAEIFLAMIPGWERSGGELWPVAALLELARKPLWEAKYWIGPGRIFHLSGLASRGIGQCCLLILPPWERYGDADPCTLPGGEPVRFYQALTLYPEEAELLVEQGLEALWDRLGGENYRVEPERKNSCGK